MNIDRWYRLAERYVTLCEDYTNAMVLERNAQRQLAESTIERNVQLRGIDERNTVALEGQSGHIVTIGRFMGGIIERLTVIESALLDKSEETKP